MQAARVGKAASGMGKGDVEGKVIQGKLMKGMSEMGKVEARKKSLYQIEDVKMI